VNFPGHTAEFKLNIMGLEGGGEITAVLLYGVGGFVFAAKQRDDGQTHWCTAYIWFSPGPKAAN